MEAQDLIYLVSCAVNGVKPEAARVAGMDLDALYKLASKHMLTAAAAHALEQAGVQDARFVKAKEHSASKNATMDMEMEAVFSELDAAGIWHMPLKGIVLQHLYPVYGMREMSDHDILFDAKRADDVRRIMEGLGFCAEELGLINHDVYHKDPVSNFEMHWALFGANADEKICAYYKDVEKKLLGDGYEKHLSPEDFYIFMIAHEYKHYTLSGTGLRSLLDTYVYLQKTSLDMRFVTAEMEKLGIAAFEATNRSLAQHLFSDGALSETEADMLDFMLASGTYGAMNVAVQKRLRDFGAGKLHYVINRFFEPLRKGSRSYRIFSQQYPFFYKHKILLPFLHLYLIYVYLRSGKLKSELTAIKNAKQ